MQTFHHISPLREQLWAAKRQGARIALVPTMGNLHEGHLRLMHEARRHADCVCASVFVNRLQFGPSEDFDDYPRTLASDSEKLSAAGVDFLFAPNEAELYPQPQTFFVEPSELQTVLEGASRPGHFRGVATVVMKLFNIVQPQVALFGKKDYQQLLVLKNMVQQLALPIEIYGVEIERAADGLALSSRNGYLSADERTIAPALQQSLQILAAALRAGRRDFSALEQEACERLDSTGNWRTDYVKICRRNDLSPTQATDVLGDWVVLAASRLGKTRLIDNLES